MTTKPSSTHAAIKATLNIAFAAALISAIPLSLTVAQTTGSGTTATGTTARGEQAGHGSMTSKAFIEDAIKGNLAEVKVGQLAQKSSNTQVQQLGMMLEKDHGEANDRAKQVAQQLGVTAPTEPNAMQKHTYDKLSKLSGAEFDKEFAKTMVEDHKKDIKKYEMEAKKSDAAGSYAQQTLPKLREHLKMAESIK